MRTIGQRFHIPPEEALKVAQYLENITTYCYKNHKTIAVAESVTSGMLQYLLSSSPRAMSIYEGGITTYNCYQKYRLLSVEPYSCHEKEGVSEGVALQMSKAAKSIFGSQIGIGVTGFASPIPEEDIHSTKAFCCITDDSDILTCHQCIEVKEDSGQEMNKIYFAIKVLQLLYTKINQHKIQ